VKVKGTTPTRIGSDQVGVDAAGQRLDVLAPEFVDPGTNVLEGTDPLVDPPLDLIEEGGQAHANARVRLVATGKFEALDLPDRQAETPEGADDADAPEGRFIEQAIVGGRPTSRVDEAPCFEVADRPDRRARPLGELPDGHV
jgi:hypothetical protein